MIETFQKYCGTGLLVSWFLVAWLYLLLKEKRKERRVLFVYMPAVMLAVFFNPLFYRIFGNLTEEAIYFRFLWILPITVVIAYCVVQVSDLLKGTQKVIFGVLAAVMIMYSGKLVYTNPLFAKAENKYHMPQEVVEICDMIRVEGREVMAAFPEEFLLYVRQYSPYVCMPYGRESMSNYDAFLDVMESDKVIVEELAAQSKPRGCHYVIFSKKQQFVGDMEAFDYQIFGEVGEYVIYEDVSIYRGLYDEIE